MHCMSLGAKHNLSMQMRLIVPTILLKVADSAAAAFHDNDGVVLICRRESLKRGGGSLLRCRISGLPSEIPRTEQHNEANTVY